MMQQQPGNGMAPPQPQQYQQQQPQQQQWMMPQQQPPHMWAQQQQQQVAPQQMIQQYGGGGGGDEIKSLWIGDLQYWMDETYVSNCFYTTGDVATVKIIRNKQTGQPEGSFVALHHAEIKERQTSDIVKDKEERERA